MKNNKKYILILGFVAIAIVIMLFISCNHKKGTNELQVEKSSVMEYSTTLCDVAIESTDEKTTSIKAEQSSSEIETTTELCTIEPETTKEPETTSKKEEETTTKKKVEKTTKKTTEKTTKKKEETTTKTPEVVWVEPSYGKAVTVKPCENYADYGWELGQVVWTLHKNETIFNGEYLLSYTWDQSFNLNVSDESEWIKFAKDLVPGPTRNGKVGEVVTTNVWVCLDGFDEYYDDPEFGTFIVSDKYPEGNYSTNGLWYLTHIWYVWEEDYYIDEEGFGHPKYNWRWSGYRKNGFTPDELMPEILNIIEKNEESIKPNYDGTIDEQVELLVYIWLPRE